MRKFGSISFEAMCINKVLRLINLFIKRMIFLLTGVKIIPKLESTRTTYFSSLGSSEIESGFNLRRKTKDQGRSQQESGNRKKIERYFLTER